MKNNNTSSTAFSGVDIGKSSGSSCSRLPEANHSGMSPRESGSRANLKGNSTAMGKPARGYSANHSGPIVGSVKPKNCGC